MHSVRIEPAKFISVGKRITYHATGDAGMKKKDKSVYYRWPGGGGGPLAAFLRVFVSCSFTSNRLVGDTYVALVDGYGRNSGTTSVFAEEKRYSSCR